MNTVPSIIQPAQPTPRAVQGKYGYYPASYETYLKLKKLNKAYWKSLRQEAAWERWDRKAPQNRLLRKRIRNEKGQVIKTEVIGPAPEPVIPPCFASVEEVPARQFGSYTIHATKRIVRKNLGFHTPAEYSKARYPMPTSEQVSPLLITPEQIDAMLKELGE